MSHPFVRPQFTAQIPTMAAQYQPPNAIPNFGEKFVGPLNKLAMARFKPPGKKANKKSDKVHITRRKRKWY